jgi:enoyl-CoA hydratase/carnithine racemase
LGQQQSSIWPTRSERRFGTRKVNSLKYCPKQTILGLGGTQRLPRRVGTPLAMELCLSGRPMSAQEAKDSGLIARVLPHENLLTETIKLAEQIGKQSPIVVRLIKEAVNRSQESSLAEGLLFERRIHQAGLNLPDAKEGMAAFVNKQKPNWSKL